MSVSGTLGVRPSTLAAWVLAALWQQRLRSLLALSGIALGVAGCMVALAVGTAAQERIVGQLEGMGLGNVYLRAVTPAGYGSGGTARPLTHARVGALEAALPTATIAAVARAERDSSLIGVTGLLPEVLNLGLAEGRFLDADDLRASRPVCVVPREWAEADGLRLGAVVPTRLGACSVIGFLRAGDVGTLRLALALPQQVTKIALTTLTRLADAQGLPLPEARLSEVIVGFPSASEAEASSRWLPRALTALGLDSSVDLISPAGQVRRALRARAMLDRMQLAFGLAILLVAGFGVMNLLLATVSERRPEIGLRRALGARHAAILGQFVTEAVALCLLGGAAGQLLGLAGLGVVELLGLETRVSLRVVLLPLASASAAGLTFGIFPAWRASQVEPLAALQGMEPS